MRVTPELDSQLLFEPSVDVPAGSSWRHLDANLVPAVREILSEIDANFFGIRVGCFTVTFDYVTAASIASFSRPLIIGLSNFSRLHPSVRAFG